MWASFLSSRRFSALQLRQAPPGVLWVTLARPDAFNALSMELLSELHAVFDALQHPPTMLAALPPDFPRVVVLAAAGRAFCGGVDIKVGGRGRSWSWRRLRLRLCHEGAQPVCSSCPARARCAPPAARLRPCGGGSPGAAAALATVCQSRALPALDPQPPAPSTSCTGG